MILKPGTVIDLAASPDIRESFLDTVLVGDDSGMYITLRSEDMADLSRFQEQLRQGISHLYVEDMFFEGLDRKNLEKVLYGTLEDIKSVINDDGRVLFARSMKELPDRMRKIYESVFHGADIGFEYDDGMDFPMKAKYTISDVIAKGVDKNVRLLLGDSYEENPLGLLNSGFLHSYFWMHGIRYFGASDFLEAVEGKKISDMVSILSQGGGIIATGESGTQTRDDTVVKAIHPEVTFSSIIVSGKSVDPLKKNDADKSVDPLKKRCILPKVLSGDTILQIIPGCDGTSGLSVRGEFIEGRPAEHILPQDMFLSSLSDLSQYVSIQENNGAIVASALLDIYILEIGGKYSVASRGKYIGNVGIDTDNEGKVTRPSLVFAKDDIIDYVGNIGYGFSVAAGSIAFLGEHHGKIQTNADIHIQKGSIILGSLYSHTGNIHFEEGVRTDRSSIISAYNGKVECDENVVGATICADEVTIRGTANRCRIFARKVHIGKNAGSQVFAEEFRIDQDIGAEASEYHILMYADAQKIPVYLQDTITSMESNGKQDDAKNMALLARLRKKQELDAKSNIIIAGKSSPSAVVRIVIVPFSLDHEYYASGVLKGPENRPTWFESLSTGKSNYRSIPVVDRKTQTDMTRKDLPKIIQQISFSSVSALATTEITPVFQKKIYMPARVNGKTEKMFLFSFSDSGEIVFVLQATPKNDEYLKTLIVDSTLPIVLDGVGDFSVQVRATIVERSVWKIRAHILDDHVQNAIRLALSERESKGSNK